MAPIAPLQCFPYAFYRTSVNLLIRDKPRGSPTRAIATVAIIPSPYSARRSLKTRGSIARYGRGRPHLHSLPLGAKNFSTNGNCGLEMGVPAVIVDEKETAFPARCHSTDPAPSRASFQSGHVRLLHTPEFCAACHKANLPEPAQRLQVHPRFHRLRRVAAIQVLAAQSALVLHCGLHKLPGLPHEARRRHAS